MVSVHGPLGKSRQSRCPQKTVLSGFESQVDYERVWPNGRGNRLKIDTGLGSTPRTRTRWWRNWQPRWTESPVSSDVRVRPPPSVLEYDIRMTVADVRPDIVGEISDEIFPSCEVRWCKVRRFFRWKWTTNLPNNPPCENPAKWVMLVTCCYRYNLVCDPCKKSSVSCSEYPYIHCAACRRWVFPRWSRV